MSERALTDAVIHARRPLSAEVAIASPAPPATDVARAEGAMPRDLVAGKAGAS